MPTLVSTAEYSLAQASSTSWEDCKAQTPAPLAFAAVIRALFGGEWSRGRAFFRFDMAGITGVGTATFRPTMDAGIPGDFAGSWRAYWQDWTADPADWVALATLTPASDVFTPSALGEQSVPLINVSGLLSSNGGLVLVSDAEETEPSAFDVAALFHMVSAGDPGIARLDYTESAPVWTGDTLPHPSDVELTAEQLYDLIHRAQPIGGKFGVELLDATGNVVRELRALSGTVYYDATKAVTRWLKLQLLEALDWESRPWVRVYQVLWGRVGGATLRKRIDRGTYIIKGIPRYQTGRTPPVFDVDGFGLETILQRFVADAYVVPAESGYTAALAGVITAASWTGKKVLSTTPEMEGMTNAEPLCWWRDPDMRWCEIASDICAQVGLIDLYVDEPGTLRTEPAQTIAESPVSWYLDTTDRATNIVREASLEVDEFDGETNWRQFLNTNDAGRTGLSPTEGDGILTLDDSGSGPVYPRTYDKSCADQATFEAECARDYADELARKRSLTLRTTPLPAVSHRMVVSANVPEVGGVEKGRLTVAEIPLKVKGNAVLVLGGSDPRPGSAKGGTGKGTIHEVTGTGPFPVTVLPDGATTPVPCTLDVGTALDFGEAGPTVGMRVTVELRTPRPPVITSVEVPGT